jgi:class 3 adenylate cyclase
MAPERVERKLVTIFAVGGEGYSPLMCTDGQVTLKTFGDYREIINTLIVRHDGRVRQGILLSRYHPVG